MRKLDVRFCLKWAKKIKAINLLGGCCKICGTNNIFVLQFHHSEDKLYEISSIIDLRWSKIEKELNKCILLCANCHNEINNKNNILIKNKLLEIKGINKCEKCGHDKIINLLFHHIRDKKLIISRCRDHRSTTNYFFKNHMEELLLEIDKCMVLCHNCHIIKHTFIDRFNKFKQIIYEKINNYIECQKPANVEEVLSLYGQGIGVVEIGKRLGYKYNTISGILHRHL